MCVYVWLDSDSGPSQSPSVLSVTAQRAGAGVSGLHHRRRGGCPGAAVSVVCALRGSLSCPWWLPRLCVFCLVPRCHRVRCDVRVLRWLDAYSRLVGGPFVARVALLACIGGLAFVVCAFGGFLL